MLNKLNKLLAIALILVLQGCGRDTTDTPKPQTKVLIGILDVRFKAGAEKFRDACAGTHHRIRRRVVPARIVQFVLDYGTRGLEWSIRAALTLPPETASLLRLPFLDWNQFTGLCLDIYARINSRTDSRWMIIVTEIASTWARCSMTLATTLA